MSETTKKWQKSSFCGSNACVEVAHHGQVIEMRDGKDPSLEALCLTAPQWEEFLLGVKDDQFDLVQK